jgi:exopolysaccharide production protein ExoQ
MVLPLAAFVFALLSTMAIVIVAGAGFRWPGRMFNYLMLLIVSTSVATIVFSGRVLALMDESLMVSSEADTGSTVYTKLLLAAVIGCSVALCVAWVFNFKNYKTSFDRFGKRGMKAPTDITIAFMVFQVAFSILPIFFGERYYFHVNLIYPLFVYLALFLWARLSAVDPVIVAKQCLAWIVFSSLIAAIVAPQLVMQPGYIGLIPGFDLRFWGVTSHANTLGAVACMLLILELAEPSTRPWLRTTILAAAALTLVLTQSKASIVAAFVGISIIFGWRLLNRTHEVIVGSKHGSSVPIVLVGSLIVSIAAIGAFAIFLDTDMLGALRSQLDARAVGTLSTATGRTLIWNAAIEGGLQSPLFGQGADFWGIENRLRLGLGGATSAHNLFLQTFSRSGLIGLAALLVFFYFLIRYSIRAAKPTRGGSLAILAVLLMRSMFETSFQLNSVLAGEFFVMIAHFTYVIDRGAKPIARV